jgi:heme oxygenase
MSILREVTEEKHRRVENLPFIQYLLKGEITKEHYVFYLYEMLQVYMMLENFSKRAGLFNGLDGLERTQNIEDDLKELDPDHYHKLCDSTQKYLDYLLELFHSENKEQLFAHVYVRHLGDMYGGKLIARIVPGSGKWYQFEDRSALVKEFNNRLKLNHAGEALKAFDFWEEIFKEMWIKLPK